MVSTSLRLSSFVVPSPFFFTVRKTEESTQLPNLSDPMERTRISDSPSEIELVKGNCLQPAYVFSGPSVYHPVTFLMYTCSCSVY